MPQPLSKVNPKASVHLGNSWDSPSEHHPALALLAMKVIAEWSILESFLTGLFLQMLGADPKPGAAMYAALTGSTAQNAVFMALADVALPPEEKDVFDAIFALYKSAAKERNKIAHWIWGHSPDIKNGVLLADPEVMMELRLAVDEHMRATTHGRKTEIPKLPIDRIYVFYDTDFIGTSQKIQRLIGLVSQFRFVQTRHHPVNADGRGFLELLKEPEIAEFLDRLHARRKTAQAAQQQSPPEEAAQ